MQHSIHKGIHLLIQIHDQRLLSDYRMTNCMIFFITMFFSSLMRKRTFLVRETGFKILWFLLPAKDLQLNKFYITRARFLNLIDTVFTSFLFLLFLFPYRIMFYRRKWEFDLWWFEELCWSSIRTFSDQ